MKSWTACLKAACLPPANPPLQEAMTHGNNSSGRHQAGGILMLLASGSLLLASAAAVARPGKGQTITANPRKRILRHLVAAPGADPRL